MTKYLWIFLLPILLLGSCKQSSAPSSDEDTFIVTNEVIESSEPDLDDYHDDYDTARDFRDSVLIDQTMIFLELVLDRDYTAISKTVDYPFDRPGPIPHIMDADEFIERAPDIFDDQLLKEVAEFKTNPEIFDYTGSNGTYWTEDYNFVFWGGGDLKEISYTSVIEASLAKSIKKEIQRLLYQPMDDYYETLYFGETKKFIFRIDYLNENDSQLRYMSWSKSKGLNEKPDLVCYDGFSEKMGTGGGVQTSFVRGDYTYMLDQVEMCGDPEECAEYLIVYELGSVISHEKCSLIMDDLRFVKSHLKEQTEQQ